jgi:hypothetical protein
MTLMTDGLSALHTLMNTHASVTIVYARSGSSVSLSAVPGELRYEQRGGNVVEDVTRRSWFVLSADLELNSVAITPARDDSITFVADDRTETYKVFGDDIDPPWEYTDSTHEQMEIRSILTAIS